MNTERNMNVTDITYTDAQTTLNQSVRLVFVFIKPHIFIKRTHRAFCLQCAYEKALTINVYVYMCMYAFEHGAITFTDHNRSSNIAPTTKIQWKISIPFTCTHSLSLSLCIACQHSECMSLKKRVCFCGAQNPHQHHICIYCAMARQTLQTCVECVSSDSDQNTPKNKAFTHFLEKSNANKNPHLT